MTRPAELDDRVVDLCDSAAPDEGDQIALGVAQIALHPRQPLDDAAEVAADVGVAMVTLALDAALGLLYRFEQTRHRRLGLGRLRRLGLCEERVDLLDRLVDRRLARTHRELAAFRHAALAEPVRPRLGRCRHQRAEPEALAEHAHLLHLLRRSEAVIAEREDLAHLPKKILRTAQCVGHVPCGSLHGECPGGEIRSRATRRGVRRRVRPGVCAKPAAAPISSRLCVPSVNSVPLGLLFAAISGG